MAEDLIRVGLIGAGGNTRNRHIPGFQKLNSVELVSVANRSRESGQRVADEFGLAKAHDHWADLLADPGIDAVCIGTWPYMHETLLVAALEAGKHVLCEARMACDAEEARRMLAASRRHPHLVAQIVPAPHTLAVDGTIEKMLADGAIGDLIAIDARIAAGSDYPQYDGEIHWRHDRTLSGNNIMVMGIWYEAMMRWVGPARTVMAVGQSVVKHRVGEGPDGSMRRLPMTIPDHVDVIGELEQGGQMRFNVSQVLGHAPMLADVYLFGTEGTLRLSQPHGGDLGLEYGKRGDAGLTPVSVDPALKGGWRVEEEFCNAIRGREPVSHTDLATGLRYMQWTDAVTRSLRLGETVAVGV